MQAHSESQDYEGAMMVRNQINAIERLGQRQDMVRPSDTEEDIINYLVQDEKVYLMLFPVHSGYPCE